jgi:hypothetical protein
MQLLMNSRWTYLGAGLLAMSLAPIVHAGIIFQTGFESTDTPAYSTGQLSGQNGWTGLTAGVVENSTAFSGSQAVSFDSTGTVGQNLMHQAITYDSLSDPDQIVVFDIHFMASATGTTSNWTVVGASGTGGLFIGGIVVSTSGLASDGFGNTVAVTRGTWNDFQLILDFTSQTASGFVNSQALGTGSFFNASTKLVSYGFGVNSSPGTDTGFFDQTSINSVPEPGYTGLLAVGIGFIVLCPRKAKAV